MTLQNTSKHIMVAILVTMLTSTTILASLPMVEAAKVRTCSTNASPKGVAAASSTEVWLSNDGGTLQKFTNLASNCNVTSYTVNGDPHFVDRSSSTKITYTNHVSDKITYFDPSTSTKVDCTNASIDGPDDIVSYDTNTQFSTIYTSGSTWYALFYNLSDSELDYEFDTAPSSGNIATDTYETSVFMENNYNSTGWTSQFSDTTLSITDARVSTDGSNWIDWDTEYKYIIDCDGYTQTNDVITGSLVSGSTATWDVDDMEDWEACD